MKSIRDYFSPFSQEAAKHGEARISGRVLLTCRCGGPSDCRNFALVRFTPYFENKVRIERPYLRMEWLALALANPIETIKQPNGRLRHWVYVEEYKKYLRVVTLEDGETVHNAFFDRGYLRRKK